MTRLSDSQLILLSRAAQQEEGILEDAGSMNPGAASKVTGALVRKKLMREIRSKPGMAIWRRDEDGRNWSLVITRAGRKAIGVEEVAGDADGPAPGGSLDAAEHAADLPDGPAATAETDGSGSHSEQETVGADTDRPVETDDPEKDQVEPREYEERQSGPDHRAIRPGSKLAAIVDLMRVDEGATIASLTEATGWLPHTTRAAMTGLRKRGFIIERLQGEDSGSRYRIASPEPSGPDAVDDGNPAMAA